MERGLPLQEVVDTLSDTLPECKVRKIAYSTFTLLKVQDDGRVYLAEFDNPPTFFFKRGYLSELQYKERAYGTRKSERRMFTWKQVTGWNGKRWRDSCRIGGLLNLDGIGKDCQIPRNPSIRRYLRAEGSPGARGSSQRALRDRPGDDTTAGVLKIRPKRFASFMIGPPVNQQDDSVVVHQFMDLPGRKIVVEAQQPELSERVLKEM